MVSAACLGVGAMISAATFLGAGPSRVVRNLSASVLNLGPVRVNGLSAVGHALAFALAAFAASRLRLILAETGSTGAEKAGGRAGRRAR